MTRVSETGWLTTGVRGWEMKPLALQPSCLHTGSSLCAKCSMAWRNNTHHVRATHNARNNFLSFFRAIALVYFYHSFSFFFLFLPPSTSPISLALSLSLCFFFSFSLYFSPWPSRASLGSTLLPSFVYYRAYKWFTGRSPYTVPDWSWFCCANSTVLIRLYVGREWVRGPFSIWALSHSFLICIIFFSLSFIHCIVPMNRIYD